MSSNPISSSGLPSIVSSSETIVSSSENIPTSHRSAIDVANQSPPLNKPADIVSSIKAAENPDWKQVGIRVLSLLAGVAMGVLTGLALAGIMVTPVGWALAGAALLIILVAAAACGGKKELWEAVKYSTVGLIFGAGIGGLAGAGIAAAAGSTSVALAGKTGVFLAGLGATVSGACGGWFLLVKEMIKSSELREAAERARWV